MYQTVQIQPLNSNFNTGADGSTVVMYDESGNVYDLGKIQGFHPTLIEEDVTLRVITQGGRELHQTERYGWKGEFTVGREDGRMDQLEYTQQQNKRQGRAELYFRIEHFINNPDGTENQHQYVKCRVKLTDAGEWSLGRAVEIKVEFTSEDRIVIS